jgi:hypothetical protein
MLHLVADKFYSKTTHSFETSTSRSGSQGLKPGAFKLLGQLHSTCAAPTALSAHASTHAYTGSPVAAVTSAPNAAAPRV